MAYKILYSIVWAIYHLFYRITVIGRENIPKGAALICGNHTAASDPLFVAIGMTSKNPLHFMAKIELLQIPILGAILNLAGAFPVRRGKSDIKAIKKSLKILGSNKKLLMFPEGTRVLSAEKAEAKTGAAMLSLRTGVPVLPVYVTPGPRRLFDCVYVVIGKPFIAAKNEYVSQSDNYHEVASVIMSKIRELGAKISVKQTGLAS
jgi:1-acyl-sn-glycerol-3-phosphate acyltransferase